MSRRLIAALFALLLTGACKIERTPPEYLDQRDPIAVERNAAAEELQDRLLALGQALSRGGAEEALIALAPAPDAYIVTPMDGGDVVGPEQIAAVLAGFGTGAVAVQIRDAKVEVGPRANVAWFRAEVDAPGMGADPAPLRLTGVYVRVEGAWQLVQAHLSSPRRPSPPAQNPPAAADSLGAG